MALERRELLRLAGLGGSAALLVACADGDDGAGPDETPRVDTAVVKGDTAVINALLDLEHAAVAGYSAGLPLLDGAARRHGGRILEHERAHADALAQAVRDLGASPARPRDRADYERGFPRLRGAGDALRFGVDLERTAVAAYLDALPKLGTAELRQVVAGILTSEAQHLAVLLGELGRPQVPDAIVTGQSG